jgi:hypothetical protein
MAFNVKKKGPITKTFELWIEHDEGVEKEPVTYRLTELERDLKYDVRTNEEGKEEVKVVEKRRGEWPAVEKGYKRREEKIEEWIDRVVVTSPFEADGQSLSAVDIARDYPEYQPLLAILRSQILMNANPFLNRIEENRREAQ